MTDYYIYCHDICYANMLIICYDQDHFYLVCKYFMMGHFNIACVCILLYILYRDFIDCRHAFLDILILLLNNIPCLVGCLWWWIMGLWSVMVNCEGMQKEKQSWFFKPLCYHAHIWCGLEVTLVFYTSNAEVMNE